MEEHTKRSRRYRELNRFAAVFCNFIPLHSSSLFELIVHFSFLPLGRYFPDLTWTGLFYDVDATTALLDRCDRNRLRPVEIGVTDNDDDDDK